MIRFILFTGLFWMGLVSNSQTFPPMRVDDRLRIHEAELVCKKYGNQIWPGIIRLPFAVILVYDSTEYLINLAKPSSDFRNQGFDTILKTQVYARRAKYPANILATFPAINGQTCIVVGVPEKTGLTTTPWIMTIIHEHFHHYTYNDPNYYKDIRKLKLSHGDTTGMWMLEYPFPYDSLSLVKHFQRFSRTLFDAIKNLDSDNFENFLQTYAKERTSLKKILKPDDYRYFSFQVWQEGVARYTEYKFLETMQNYKPSPEVKEMSDFIPFETYKEQLFKEELDKLVNDKLSEKRRSYFYAVGFAEALMLDYLNPNWHKKYLKDKFYLERY